MDPEAIQIRAVVVLAMHRTGSSLIANLLHNTMGVRMGDRFLGKGPWNHHGVWEDLDFLNMNKRLLRGSGAIKPVWRHPPAQEDIDFRVNVIPVVIAIRSLVYRKSSGNNGLWGWKDPRTCLTIGLYAPHLVDPLYVVTKRNEADTIKSLEKRGKKRGDEFWRSLIHRYERTRDRFLDETDAPRVVVEFERLTNKDTWTEEYNRIAVALGAMPDHEKAKGIIEWR